MPALSDQRLRSLLLGSLPGCQVVSDMGHTKPIIVSIPDFGACRIYLWTTTPDASLQGRPAGEHKAQIILPGTPRGSTQYLDVDEVPTALLGYSPLFGVFTTWEARLHLQSGYSKNLQFKEDILEECIGNGWAVSPQRRTNNGPEIRVAVHPLHLSRYLQAMKDADAMHLSGEQRRQFFNSRHPMLVPEIPDQLGADAFPGATRERVASTRLERSASFGPMILAQFEDACAICQTQLRIVEGAHIIPVHDERCRDEVWNGVCLCRNHHRLFDRKLVRLNPDGVIGVQDDDINCLRGLGVLGGFESIIEPFIGQTIRMPNFFNHDAKLRRLFRGALAMMK